MGDLEEEEDYEAFEMRQKAEQTVANHEAEAFDKKQDGGAHDGGSDDDLERGGDADGLEDSCCE